MKFIALFLLLAAPATAAFTPSSYLKFDSKPEDILPRCRAARQRAEAALQGLASLSPSAQTFENTPEALENVLWDLTDSEASDTFLKYVAVSSATRAAAHECETLLAQFGVDVFTREDLYKALTAYAAKKEPLEGEAKKLLEKELLDFRRNGLTLEPGQRRQVKDLKKRLVDLELAFGKNLNDVKDFLPVTRAELDGLPDDYINGLQKEGDKYKVTLDYPDYFPFMNNARDPNARKRLEFLYNNRAEKENLPLLKEILSLRRKAAALMGYKTHAHYVLEERMAKDPGRVKDFIDSLEKRLKVLAEKELDVLVRLKAAEEGSKSDGKINAWDWRYYDNKLKKERYQVDLEQIKEYFPMEKVTEGLLSVYQELLGVKFRLIPDAVVWHPDVNLYEITDAAGGPPIGYFYMDLYPRDGKYKHAAAFDIVKGRLRPDGSYQAPVSAMVANFNKPTPDRPSLLKHGEHEEVSTYFHEFGHIMHQTLTRAKYGRFSGSSVARDFVEAPSQMLENWVWDPVVLAKLSGHYKDRSKPLPKELLEKMLAAKNVNSGLVNLRQLFFASVDMAYHTTPSLKDTTSVYEKLMKKISLIPMSNGTHPEASFGHLMGYDAGYYGYMWSKVYAEDMFTRFEEEGLLNPVIGRRYRETILESGGSKDEAELLRKFLGREPSQEGFLRSLGLSSGKEKKS